MNSIYEDDFSGKALPGISLNDKLWMGHLPLGAMMHYGLKRPSLVEHSKERERRVDPALLATYSLREQVQRRFDKARLTRAEAFCKYLAEIYRNEREGGFPPVTLYTPRQGNVGENRLIIDYDAPIVNLDGETQTEARFILAAEWPESTKFPVPFLLYHGISPEHAAAIMHDVNFYAKPVSEQKVAILNSYGNLTSVIRDVLHKSNIPPGQVTRLSNIAHKKHLVAYPGLVAGAAGALVGREVSDSLPRYITRLNNYTNGERAENARPFLEHAVQTALAERAIGRTSPTIWALVGGHYHDTSELLNGSQWLALAEAYSSIRLPKEAPHKALTKRQVAFKQAIGIEI